MKIVIFALPLITNALSARHQAVIDTSFDIEQYGMGALFPPSDPLGSSHRAVSSNLARDFLQQRRLALSKPPSEKDDETNSNLISSLPDTFDLRDQSYVTSVKNQKHCGMCTAFATMATLESSYHKQHNLPLTSPAPHIEMDLSETSLYSCSARVECSPGGMYLEDAMEIIEHIGVQTELSVPYDSLNLQCSRRNSHFLPLSFKSTFLPTVALVQEWIRTKGSVMTAFLVPQNFISILVSNGGIYDYEGNDEIRGGHAVSCVGYDNSYTNKKGKVVGAWICKNSWGIEFGSQWGDPGYFRIAFGQLGIMAEAYGVEVSKKSECTYGRKSTIDLFPLQDTRVAEYNSTMDACDAVKLANERVIGYWAYDVVSYLKQGMGGYTNSIDCEKSALYNKNEIETRVLAQKSSNKIFGATPEDLYEALKCRIIKQ